ncbi:hypothetical protein K435DRAFT_879139 [Dendrothele bispora CBS 962.96]|uniref:Uncharacterized protein n=1 Tax=Dendrothele bispora (strain CBS 962.96) TaxID=1314807 RepID=A0A4S8KLS0_DENBC|nr:hypothetical protein K435DRAFT_879139 [Dendrothele bispora CBS 962.96]
MVRPEPADATTADATTAVTLTVVAWPVRMMIIWGWSSTLIRYTRYGGCAMAYGGRRKFRFHTILNVADVLQVLFYKKTVVCPLFSAPCLVLSSTQSTASSHGPPFPPPLSFSGSFSPSFQYLVASAGASPSSEKIDTFYNHPPTPSNSSHTVFPVLASPVAIATTTLEQAASTKDSFL